MKITYNWLKQYVDFDASPEELVKQLTMLGLEVDSVVAECINFDGIVVGHVTDKQSHPDADKLSVCQVDVGSEICTIVCGAPNVDIGQNVPVATVGTRLPGGLKIKKSKIRGVESYGMICSEMELGLSEASDGIMILDSNLEIGSPFQDVLGEPDYLLDVDVTPNRPDCFGILGIARDIAADANSKFQRPLVKLEESIKSVKDTIKVSIHDSDKCPRYTARFIGNVEVKPSPLWLVRRLQQIGIRPINNIVDITNFVMMETGQPLHAFDYGLIEGHEIQVRCADDGEMFTTLDGKKHTLNSDNLLICDNAKSVALAGIMGGQNSEVSDKTVNVLLESAYFDPVNVRRSAKSLGISTESSKRFERGVDPNGVDYALDRAAQLIAELASGEVAKGIADEYPKQIRPITLSLRPGRVKLLLGVEVPTITIKTVLSNLGFGVDGDDVLAVVVPTFRPDVTREADLIEEVGRVYGYDNIPADFSAVVQQNAPVHEMQQTEALVKTTLAGFGFSEVVTYNLVSKKSALLFASEDQHVYLINPLSEDLSTLRPNLLVSLLNSVRWNRNRSIKDLKFFELGTAFSVESERPVEHQRLTGIVTGNLQEKSWRGESSPVDFYTIKGFVEHLLQRCHMPQPRFELQESLSVCSNGLVVYCENEAIGSFGELSTHVLKTFDIEQPVFYFDLDFAPFEKYGAGNTSFEPIPKFPFVHRDLALVVAETVAAQDVLTEVETSAGPLLSNVHVFDVYRGAQVDEGEKSLALGLTFISHERTLKEKEIDKQMAKVLRAMEAKFSAHLRA